jgi:Holliday junction resolvase-like predicted endonuclease
MGESHTLLYRGKDSNARAIKPAEAGVDREKPRALVSVAREYPRHAPPSCQWRFDVVSVYYDERSSPPQSPQFELFQNAFQIS